MVRKLQDMGEARGEDQGLDLIDGVGLDKDEERE